MEAKRRLPMELESALAVLAIRPIAVAFSGGLDSTALLHALSQSPAARERGLRAIHVDHGLHAQSADWAAHCRRICLACEVPLSVRRVKVERDSGLGLEAAARRARYSAFADELVDGEMLAFAHHRDDQAETVLLKLLRGAGPEGLGAMRSLRPLGKAWAWRPLLAITREELRDHVSQSGLEWLDDPSNEDCSLDRNYLRREVLPSLRSRWPQADASIGQSAHWIRLAADFIDVQAAQALAQLLGPDRATLRHQQWLALPEALRDPALRRWLRSLALPEPNQFQVAELARQLGQAAAHKLPCVRWPGTELRRYREWLYAMPVLELPPSGWEQDWDGQPLQLPAGLGSLLLLDETAEDAALPSEQTLRVRFRRGGERIRLVGASHHRDLRDLFQEAGIPPWQRGRIPFVLDQRGDLLAVGNTWISDAGATLFAQLRRQLRWNHALTLP